MYISLSDEKRIREIPEQGAAIIGGYWTPEKGKIAEAHYLQWDKGKVNALIPWPVVQGRLKEAEETGEASLFQWDAYTLMPGFIDVHVHLALDSIDFYQCLENWRDSAYMETSIQEYLKTYLSLGIVGIRDGSDLPGYGWLAKKRLENGEWIGPKVVAVREGIGRQGMYGRFLGRGFARVEDWLDIQEDFLCQGADQLKVLETGIISFSEYGKVGAVQWSVEELGKIVKAAHAHGLLVMVHASGVEGITKAIAAGVDSIEHGYYMNSEHLREMKARCITWVPTVAPIGNLLKYPSDRYSAKELGVLAQILQGHLRTIKEAYELGVSLGIGTDAGAYRVPHGDSFYDEMEWFKEAGIPEREVLRLATQENARICGLADYGKLETGTPMSSLQLKTLND